MDSPTLSPAVESPLQRATSPSFFANLSFKASRSRNRPRSNTNPTPPATLQPEPSTRQSIELTRSQNAYKELSVAFYSINSRYRISWECADLLIELGGAGGSNTASANDSVISAPPTSTSAPIVPLSQAPRSVGTKKSRERAITLAGDETKPTPTLSTISGSNSLPGSTLHANRTSSDPPLASPPSNSWRASTGRHDLSQRQLVLLREMLNNSNAATSANGDSHLSIPEESVRPPMHSLHAINRDWRWGDARNSTITLPSEESAGLCYDGSYRTSIERERDRKRRSGRLGMAGLRDMLRALKRHAESGNGGPDGPSSPPASQILPKEGRLPSMTQSTTSLSTESSSSRHWHSNHRVPSQQQQRRRAKTSTGPESIRSTREQDFGKGNIRESRATSPYAPSSFTAPKPSPRRPSLASIFRLGSKNRPTSTAEGLTPTPLPSSAGTDDSGIGDESSSTGEEDWDRMDSASDLDAAAKGLGLYPEGAATVRGRREGSHRKREGVRKGRSPYLQHDFRPDEPSPPLPSPLPSVGAIIPKRSFSASQPTLWTSDQSSQAQLQQDSPLSPGNLPSRPTRLSNVEEHADDPNPKPAVPLPNSRSASSSYSKSQVRPPKAGASPSRPPSTIGTLPRSGSVRSMVPQSTVPILPDPKLAMTPENIRPLLANAKEVHLRLSECIHEIRYLIEQNVADPHSIRHPS